ncbi:hypothetical protein N7530_000375 [Penicillium desertorum]|uniref:Uncharacterized protein n=1 Tax=Penicillium desertorum TaxID=1303715 RepID=A0A9X0BVV9_9EURO|nr:hypothetical protein N7530_000375 [Penicillium desertorum]
MVTLPISKIFVLGSALFASTSYTLKLNAVWTTGSWSAIGPPGGSGSSGHTNGFSLVNEADETVWSDSYPGGYAACGGGYGHTFSLTGGCLPEGTEYHFNCWSKSTNPDKCSIRNKDGSNIALADGQSSTHFIGIALGIDGYCGTSWDLGDVDCPANTQGFTATYLGDEEGL